MAKNLVPIPEVDFERDGIIFENLGLPVGFDEERLLVDTNGLRRIRNIAFLGPAIFMGVSGTKRENMFNVAGVDEKGVATMGLMRRKKRQEIVEKVAIVRPKANSYSTYRPEVLIEHNLAEQAERIDEQEGADRFFNAQHYAECLNFSLTDGLAKAIKLRHLLRVRPVGRFMTLGAVGYNGITDTTQLLNNQPELAFNLPLLLALFAATEMVLAKKDKHNLNEVDISTCLGWDRRLLGSFVARNSTLISAAK